VRYEVELLKNKKFLLKGTRERHDYFLFESPAQVNGAPAEKVWLLRSKTGSYNTQFLWAHKFSTFEDACSNYTRFKPDVEFVPILSLSSKAAECPASRF
jgi:hypothetical protein